MYSGTFATNRCWRARHRRGTASASSRAATGGNLATASALALAALVGIGALVVSTVVTWKANKEVWKANKDLQESVDRERREAYFQRITVAHHELSIDHLAAALRASRSVRKTCGTGSGTTSCGSAGPSRW